MASGAGYLGAALVGASSIDSPVGWVFLALAGADMGVALIGGLSPATASLTSAPAPHSSAALSPLG